MRLISIRAERTDARRLRWLAVLSIIALVAATGAAAASLTRPQPVDAAAGCRIFVAAGDDIPAGHDLNDDAKRYPEQLLEDHLISPGWCVYNQGKNGQTSSAFITGGGMANSYNMRPDLLTIQLGEQNTPDRQPHHVLLRQDQGPRLLGRQRLRRPGPRQPDRLRQPPKQLHDDPPDDPGHGLAATAARDRRRQLREPLPAGHRRGPEVHGAVRRRSSTR